MTLLLIVMALSVLAGVPAAAQRQAFPDQARVAIVDQLGHGRRAEALATYESYVDQVKHHDLDLLRQIGAAEIRYHATGNDPLLKIIAVEGLAAQGNTDAVQFLRNLVEAGTTTSEHGLTAALGLYRLGDTSGLSALRRLLREVPPEHRAAVIKGLQDVGARSEAERIAEFLNDDLPTVRIAAISAVAALGYTPALPRLREIHEAGHPTYRMLAAIAMKRLGDSSVDAIVSKLLASEVPEVRLMAVAAYPASPRAPWAERIRELHADRNEVIRIRAAETLACCEPDVAKAILRDALRSPVPPLRLEAAKVLERRQLADAGLVLRLLRDDWEAVRLYGALAADRLR